MPCTSVLVTKYYGQLESELQNRVQVELLAGVGPWEFRLSDETRGIRTEARAKVASGGSAVLPWLRAWTPRHSTTFITIPLKKEEQSDNTC